jgi:hypothetical protein
VHIEQGLKLFIGVVDAELLKGVGHENLEPKDVQNADKA